MFQRRIKMTYSFHRIILLSLLSLTIIPCFPVAKAQQQTSLTTKNHGNQKNPADNIQSLNSRPVIGVLTQPISSSPSNPQSLTSTHYIAASYVKWLESAGARSIAIPQNADNATIDSLFPTINGVLLTGGGNGMGPGLPDSVRRIWDLARQQNDNGDIFPVWGTCLGFEMMVRLVASTSIATRSETDKDTITNILWTNYTAENLALPLQFTNDVSQSILFVNPYIRRIAESMNVTMNFHQKGITPQIFEKNQHLSEMFRIISTNFDRNNQPFVSTIEAFDYPFFGVQWHPEKNNFEYLTVNDIHNVDGEYYNNNNDIPLQNNPHFSEAVRLSLEMALTFVDISRKNSNIYKPMKDYPLMWNYPLKKGTYFEQEYFIDVSHMNQVNDKTRTDFNENRINSIRKSETKVN